MPDVLPRLQSAVRGTGGTARNKRDVCAADQVNRPHHQARD